jgi:hypothetical protein
MRATASLLCLLALASQAVATAPELRWVRTYEGGGAYTDDVADVLALPDGDLILAGVSADGVDGVDMLVCRLDRADGALLWERRVAIFAENDMATSGVVPDGLGDLFVSGYVVGCET